MGHERDRRRVVGDYNTVRAKTAPLRFRPVLRPSRVGTVEGRRADRYRNAPRTCWEPCADVAVPSICFAERGDPKGCVHIYRAVDPPSRGNRRRDAAPGQEPGQIPGVLILRFVHDCLDIPLQTTSFGRGSLPVTTELAEGPAAYRQPVAVVQDEMLVDVWPALLMRGLRRTRRPSRRADRASVGGEHRGQPMGISPCSSRAAV